MLHSYYMEMKEAGRQGGLARAKNMSPEERSESARKAAMARHAKDIPRENNCQHPDRNVYEDGYWNCPGCPESGNIDDKNPSDAAA